MDKSRKAAAQERTSEERREAKEQAILVKIDSLRVDGGTQLRSGMENYQIETYADRYRELGPWALPPVLVYFDGSSNWLSDGFHRRSGAKAAGLDEIPAFVRAGDLQTAIFEACGANKNNGLARCKDTVQRAVRSAIKCKPDWSNARIAKHVGVHINTVLTWRTRMEDEKRKSEERSSPGTTPERKPRVVLGTDGRTKTIQPRPGKPEVTERIPDRAMAALPLDLHDIFADPALSELAKSLRIITREIQIADPTKTVLSYTPTHPWMNPQAIDEFIGEACRLLAAAAEQIESNLPSCVCPSCNGEGGDCASCTPEGRTKGCGWMPGWRYISFIKGIQ